MTASTAVRSGKSTMTSPPLIAQAIEAPESSLAIGDMPRDLAHAVNDQLLDVITLLHASMSEVDDCNEVGADKDGITSPASRATALIFMADERVRQVLRAISPYV